MIKDLKIVELINERLGSYHDESLSAGETVAGMIINGLGFSNNLQQPPTPPTNPYR